jgi:hypothetical protein
MYKQCHTAMENVHGEKVSSEWAYSRSPLSVPFRKYSIRFTVYRPSYTIAAVDSIVKQHTYDTMRYIKFGFKFKSHKIKPQLSSCQYQSYESDGNNST